MWTSPGDHLKVNLPRLLYGQRLKNCSGTDTRYDPIVSSKSRILSNQVSQSITLGISNSRRFIATACKSTNAEHAVVRIYDTASFKAFGQPLSGHVLTVTRIAFSPDDKLALTVSRDRTWRLFELQNDSSTSSLLLYHHETQQTHDRKISCRLPLTRATDESFGIAPGHLKATSSLPLHATRRLRSGSALRKATQVGLLWKRSRPPRLLQPSPSHRRGHKHGECDIYLWMEPAIGHEV